MVDVLIVGQGVAGSVLAHKLINLKKDIRIIDPVKPAFFEKLSGSVLTDPSKKWLLHFSSIYPLVKKVLGGSSAMSRVIGGLITPITGKRLLKTWMCETYLPAAEHFYHNLEVILKTPLYQPYPIVRIFASAEQSNEWSVKSILEDYKPYIANYSFSNNRINAPFGHTVFDKGAVVNGSLMLEKYNDFFQEKGVLIRDHFDYNDLKVQVDFVEWKNISAQKIIFCEGWQALKNPFFKYLPFRPSKGELLVIKSKKLQLKEIINRGIFIRPLTSDFYLVGSTYTWNDLTKKATETAKKEMTEKLDSLLRVPYSIIDHFAGIRPTVLNRRPFLGAHSQHKNLFIFNGLGTKGLLLAPYLAGHLCDYIFSGKELIPEVDIRRFEKN